MENTNHSIVFTTANGNEVEVTRAQMDRVRSKLWHDLQPTQSGQKNMAVNKSENKENEIDYFGDTSDFELDSDFEENILVRHFHLQSFF